MKKYRFSLQKVLEYKENILEQEKNILREMQGIRAQMQTDLDNAIRENERKKNAYQAKTKVGMPVFEVIWQKNYQATLQKEIERQESELEKQQIEIERQMLRLTEVKTEKASIERLKEKDMEAYKTMEQKEAEIYVDEFVANTTVKNKST